MDRKEKAFEQYLSHEGDDFDVTDYLKQTAPIIGFIVHRFNDLEQSLNKIICEIISDRTDEPGLMIIHRMPYSEKVNLFDRFSNSLHSAIDKDVPIYPKLIMQLKECSTLRNAVVHADWESMDDAGYTFLKVKITKTGLKKEYIQFTVESLA